MIVVKRYTEQEADEWNDFVASSKNGTFLFDRRFMDYHADRFTDCSLMFFSNNKLVALLPANVDGTVLYSHGGLTYGGIVASKGFTVSMALELFDVLSLWLRDCGIVKVVYKPLPYIYHIEPSEEDLYAIFRQKSVRVIGRDVATVINLGRQLPWMQLRRRGVKKAIANGILVRIGDDFEDFWRVLDGNLMSRYSVHPVHSLEEIRRLAKQFPEQIVLYEALINGKVLAGIVLFVTSRTVHVQYISASNEGKACGALDLIFRQAINDYSSTHDYFDFGKSTERMGSYLNESLIFQKEGFGGRAVCYDTYEWTL